MAKTQVYNVSGLNLKTNPMLHKDGELLRSVNVDPFPIGGKTKRSGYNTYLGTMPNGSVVQDMMTWQKESGTQFWNYAFAGGLLYYSTQGTGAWTICGNGTFSPLGTLTHAEAPYSGTSNFLFIGDGVGTIHYTTNGTSFINNGTVLWDGVSTTAAPIAVSLANFHNRIYAAGTGSGLSYSTFGTPNGWTTDSTSFPIDGPGKLTSLYTTGDVLVANKNSGVSASWDGFNLIYFTDVLGPTSTRSISGIDADVLYLNRQGIYANKMITPKLISAPIERQIYNNSGSAVAGTVFDNAPAVAHKYKYYLQVGTTTDDLTDTSIADANIVYDYQLNQYTNYQFAHRPTAWLSYEDVNGDAQLLFASGSQVYQMSGTATSDAGFPIETDIRGVLHFDKPELDKKFNYIWAFFNPGCQAKIQVAIADTFTKGKLNWLDLKDTSDGITEMKFPAGSRGKLLFYRIYDSSATNPYTFHGLSVDYDEIERK